MRFYVGTHKVGHAKHLRCAFISVNVLRRRKSDFEANDWILDSGAFTEISTYGDFRTSVENYATEINRWARCGNLEMAVTQDYMCEPFMLKRTGKSVSEHQSLTIGRYDKLVNLTDIPIMPVLQGYQVEDYLKHLDMYGDRLKPNMRVGVGSVCKRNAKPSEVARILEAVKRESPDLRLHGFGLKTTALANAYIFSLLYSADSMAWSFRARKNGGDANSIDEALKFAKEVEDIAGIKPYQWELRL